MDSLTIRCRSCARLLKLPPTALGKDVKCPVCQTIFTVRQDDLNSAAVPSADPIGITSRPPPELPKTTQPPPDDDDAELARRRQEFPSRRRSDDDDELPSRRRRDSDDDRDSRRRRSEFDEELDAERGYRRRDRRLELAIQSAAGPAIALIVLGVGELVISMFFLLLTGIPPEHQEDPDHRPIVLVIGLMGICWGGLTLAGGIMMKLMKSYGFVMFVSILVLVPLPCCVLNIALGIWSLVVLSDPDVKRAFEMNRR